MSARAGAASGWAVGTEMRRRIAAPKPVSTDIRGGQTILSVRLLPRRTDRIVCPPHKTRKFVRMRLRRAEPPWVGETSPPGVDINVRAGAELFGPAVDLALQARGLEQAADL